MTTTLEPADKLGTTATEVAVVNGPQDELLDWDAVDWRTHEQNVRRLRQRIFTASQVGDLKRVRNLQKLMLRSRSNTLLAVRRVTEINAGRLTAGVDGRIVLDAEGKAGLVEQIHRRQQPWQARPVKRVYIPKADGRRRPLGIPVIVDRVLQARVAAALEPEWEARFEPRSYGFRPGRSCQDAIQATFSTVKGPNPARRWVLDADLKAAFDRIDHHHLLGQLGGFPAREQVRDWLTAGVVDQGLFTRTEEGTPQGGVVSPLLLNVALQGMEHAAGVRYRTIGIDGVATARDSPTLIRYADDFVALCRTRDEAIQVKARLAVWLTPRGLAFNEDKTRVVDLDEGYDFLGFNVRRYHGLLLIKPSKAAVRRIRETATHRSACTARQQRRRGDRPPQPDHPRLGGLLPGGSGQRDLQLAGSLPVETGLQVGQTHPPEQADELGRGPLLRHVQQVPARPVGLRRPRQRRLPTTVRLDQDRAAPTSHRHRVTR
jgi:RNA-directed DNA polymerase